MLLWFAASSLSVVPFQIAYANELIGGPANSYRYLAGGNVDWDQSNYLVSVEKEALKAELKKAQEANPTAETIKVFAAENVCSYKKGIVIAKVNDLCVEPYRSGKACDIGISGTMTPCASWLAGYPVVKVVGDTHFFFDTTRPKVFNNYASPPDTLAAVGRFLGVPFFA